MSGQLNVFVSTPVCIDLDVYNLWLQGYSVEGAISYQLKSLAGEWGRDEREYLRGEIQDQYRNFNVLLHFLKHPTYFATQCLFQLAPEVQQRLLEQYYAFDDEVMREFLGKKMSSRMRKDLDDVCEKTGRTVFNVRRQFDNLKRIYKLVEDMPGGLAASVQANFLLSPRMSELYARIVFINSNRLETTKRKLSYLTFSHFQECAGAMMSGWTEDPAQPGESLDHVFLLELRELQRFVTGEKGVLDNWRVQTKTFCQEKGATDAMLNHLQKLFKNTLKNVMSVGANLSQSKELRDFFVDVLERIVEPMRAGGWGKAEAGMVFDGAIETFPSVVTDPARARHVMLMKRLLPVFARCVLVMIPA